MKSVFDITLSIAACTSAAIAACWAFRSTRGSLLFSPDIRPFEITLEAHELVDVLDANGRVARDNDAGLDRLGHDASGADERSGADANAGKYRGVGADAHVILHRGAEHAVEVARAHRVRVVREDDMRAEKHSCAERDVLQEAAAVDSRPAADAVSRLEHRVGADAAVVADHVVLADERAVAAVEPIADDGSGIDDRAGADHAAGADHRLQLAWLLAPRRLADDCAFVHIRALADADVGVDHAMPSRDDDAARSSRCARSRTFTIATPSSAEAMGRRPVTMQSTKCSSCSRSGSRWSSLGMTMSPSRTAAMNSANPPSRGW